LVYVTAPLRVLIVIDRVEGSGGAERYAAGLATHMPRDRIAPWVCTTRSSAEPAATAALAAAGVPHTDLGRTSRWQVHRLAGLLRLLRYERFDVVHAHKFGSNLWGTLAGRACGVPVVIAHEHTWSYEGRPLRRWLDGRVIGRLATRFIAVSSADAERMAGIEGVPRDKIVVIPTSHVPRPGSAGGDVRRELGLGRDAAVVAVAAQLRPQKALGVLLAAHARLLRERGDVHLVIAGDGACRPQLEAHVRRLRSERAVHFLGRRDDVDAILVAADVAALSSDFEGSPLFAFECIASRTPLVATAVGGLPDIVEHGRTGLLVPRRDPDALAAAIGCLLDDPAQRQRMAAQAAARHKPSTIDAAAGRFADLYEALTAEVAR
jgi:glycosyltransferase involved in cell wall biosynthesis